MDINGNHQLSKIEERSSYKFFSLFGQYLARTRLEISRNIHKSHRFQNFTAGNKRNLKTIGQNNGGGLLYLEFIQQFHNCGSKILLS